MADFVLGCIKSDLWTQHPIHESRDQLPHKHKIYGLGNGKKTQIKLGVEMENAGAFMGYCLHGTTI